MFTQKCNSFIHFYLLGPYTILKDNVIGSFRSRNVEFGEHTGEVAVITGGHRGIGSKVTESLLTVGMHVIMGCRNVEDGNKFVEQMRDQGLSSGKVTVLALNLASFESVKIFAQAVIKETNTINYIINNAGILQSEYNETNDKFEAHWQVNYLSHFLLCHLLLPTLEVTCGPCKIVNVSSFVHKAALSINYDNISNKKDYNGPSAYAASKLAQVMFTLYLNEKLKSINSRIEVVVAHPGIVNTEIFDGTPVKKYFSIIASLFFKSPQQGAKPIVYATLYGKGGEYIGNCAPESTSSLSRNKAEQEKLFDKSKELLQITLFGNIF